MYEELFSMMYPLKFQPLLKERIWGGTNLNRYLGRVLPGDKIGESWDIACHDSGTTKVSEGTFVGKSLRELIDMYPQELLGKSVYMKYGTSFPLLIKILDAQDILSVQVHPDNEKARRLDNEAYGKSEMWYVLYAKEGAQIVFGLKDCTSRQELARAIQEGCLEKHLNRVRVRKGDIFNIPPGTVHALGAGIMVAEIQQNSDAVYRLYDWNRVDDNGRPRELHVHKALEAVDFSGGQSHDRVCIEDDDSSGVIIKNDFYTIEFLSVKGTMALVSNPERFNTLTVVEGKGHIEFEGETYKLNLGDSLLIPAFMGDYSIKGSLKLLSAYVG
jgi:mannose-6-phosphate isomerase